MRRGFTLVELAIVLTVAALVVAAALPSWRQARLQAHRADGIAALQQAALSLQSRHARQGSYLGASLGPGGTAPSVSPEGRYALRLARLDGDVFRLEAVPQDAQRADACGTLSIDHLGDLRFGPSSRPLRDGIACVSGERVALP